MPDYFWGQAYITSFYVVFNIIAERWPVIFLVNKFLCVFNFEMVC